MHEIQTDGVRFDPFEIDFLFIFLSTLDVNW